MLPRHAGGLGLLEGIETQHEVAAFLVELLHLLRELADVHLQPLDLRAGHNQIEFGLGSVGGRQCRDHPPDRDRPDRGGEAGDGDDPVR